MTLRTSMRLPLTTVLRRRGVSRGPLLPALKCSLPAQGDCLWVEYGDPMHPSRLLVDGGTPETSVALRKRVTQLPENDRHFDLLIVTHIDNDHIGGVLELLGEDLPGLSFDDIWFNAWRHLPETGLEKFGPVQGEKLSTLLDRSYGPWNKCFDGRGSGCNRGGASAGEAAAW